MFRWSLAADAWTKSLLSPPEKNGLGTPFNTKFSIYYLFAMAGIGLGKCQPTHGTEMRDLIRNVPIDFQEYRHLLAGVMLTAQLTNEGHQLGYNIVKDNVLKILSLDGPAFLSPDAVDLLNCYAHGGFETIRDILSHPPKPSEFLVWYYDDFISKRCFQDRNWTE